MPNLNIPSLPHNPDNLTPEQIGVADGWRLLNEDEIQVIHDVPRTALMSVERWHHEGYWLDGGWAAALDFATYRTKLSPAELRKARGLEPKAEAIEGNAQIADLEKLLLAKDEALRYTTERHQGTFGFEGGKVMTALALTPAAVRAKYVPAEDLRRVSEERDTAKARLEQFENASVNNRMATILALEGIGGVEVSLEALTSPGIPEVMNMLTERIRASESERDSLAARVKELEALEKLRNKHVEVLRELERVKEELSRVSNYLRIEKQTHQEWEDSLRAQLSAANEAREKAEASARENAALADDGQALSELVWAHSAEGSDAYEVEVVLESHYEALDALRRKLEEAQSHKLEADATVERMREALRASDAWPVADLLTKLADAADILIHQYDYTKERWEEISGAAIDARPAAEEIREALALPRSTALREHDLSLAERAWKEGYIAGNNECEKCAPPWLASDLCRELTKGEGK